MTYMIKCNLFDSHLTLKSMINATRDIIFDCGSYYSENYHLNRLIFRM